MVVGVTIRPATTVNDTLTKRRRTMARQRMNRTVPFRHWLYLIGLGVAVLVLSSAYAGKSQGEFFEPWFAPEVAAGPGDTGFITENTHLCHTNAITHQTISALDQWTALIARLDAAGGAALLSQEDNDLGVGLSQWCSTLSEGYPVVLTSTKGDHALAVFHWELGFSDAPFIIRLDDFHTGGLEL